MLDQGFQAKTDEATKAGADLRTAQGRADEATRQSETLRTQMTQLSACQKAVQDFFNALNRNDDTAGGLAVLAIQRSCEGVKVV